MADLEGMDRETKELALLLKMECMEKLKEWAEEAAVDPDAWVDKRKENKFVSSGWLALKNC